jgi:ABC-type transport system involved in multi-copper enzyme maturation permease subunit
MLCPSAQNERRTRTLMPPLFWLAFFLYVAVGLSYFVYHALRITRSLSGVGKRRRFYLFWLMTNVGFWNIRERNIVSQQTPELKAYILRIEIQKLLYAGVGGLVFTVWMATTLLPRSVAN